MKAILIAFLLILFALACTTLNPTSEPYPSMTPNASRGMTATAQTSLSDNEIRQTQVALVETATALVPYIPSTQAAEMTRMMSDFSTSFALATLGIDSYSLTATGIVQTATANAQGANPQPSQDPILLTATAIIKQATIRAATQSP